MSSLFGLDSLAELATNKTAKPSNLELIYYLFWDKGISFEEFERLPIPYIIGIISTHMYIKEQEKQELEKKHGK